MLQALIVAGVYWLCQVLDSITGMQTITRPIVLGTMTGLACGDLQTGVMMGAGLEAIFMGISPIGGVAATDTRVSTVMATAFVILSDIPQETGLALAVTVGALINSIAPLNKAFMVSYHPLFVRYTDRGDFKGFRRMMWIDAIFLKFLFNTSIIFFSIFVGTDAVGNLIGLIPPFILAGMNAAAGMLVVVGFCITTQSIWNSWTPVYVILGFVLSKYLGLNITAIALIALVVALLGFKRSKEIFDSKSKLATAGTTNEEDDFYG